MMVPKIKFENFDIEENLEQLVWYLKPENSKNRPHDFYGLTLYLFPELNGELRENMSMEEIYMILDRKVRPILETVYNNSEYPLKCQSVWDKVNDDVMISLEKRLDTKWDCELVTCKIGLLPVCPRDIVEKTFLINYGCDKKKLMAIAIHELCHFIYFKKWIEIFPDYKEEEFNFPHIAWYLSEAMIDPLINNDIFKKYTDDLLSYPMFYKIFIKDKSVIEILRDYVKSYPIHEAIKRGYELFQKYENEIKGYKE